MLHVITGLERGGAEGVLARLVIGDTAHEHRVISLMGAGVHGATLAEAGVPVEALGMPRGRVTLQGLARLRRLIRDVAPDVVQTWMYHADLIGGTAARLAGVPAVVWGLRNAYLDPRTISASTRTVARLCARMSRHVPARIVSCSAAGAASHVAIGYDAGRMVVIHNGYDLHALAPDDEGRRRVRADWGIAPDAPLVGMVARWDPQKDHATLLAALEQLPAGPARRCVVVLVGAGMTSENTELAALLDRHAVRSQVRLVGPRTDIRAVMSALDVHVLSSAGEAFPNVVAEAMACGTPCVVTDVGDAAAIVGETGWVVPPRAPAALAAAVATAVAEVVEGRATARREAARARIAERFGLDAMRRAYGALWRDTSAAVAAARKGR
ncbi:MAG TPA: glycosyltransferase [Gemmatimonadales bacterium]|nr:glycosyltransferase [Gemmatimonadales bacterium]